RDGNVTKIGSRLRRSGLDEIPQFINIFKGEMSIVGPRALTMNDVVRLGWDQRYYIRRWHVKPGITGLGQLYAGRSAHHSWLFDKTYLKKSSFRLDLQIVVLSSLMNLLGKQPIRAWLYGRTMRRPTYRENWQHWETVFIARKNRPFPNELVGTSQQPWSLPLARSLAIFQLGESGGGTIVRQVQNSRIEGTNSTYSRAMALFVDEEHRHADLLEYCVRSLGGQLIHHNWTAKLFVAGRRLMGLRLKVLVLLAAEVVGICYYKLLASRVPHAQLRTILEELAQDEEAHLQFHSAFLRMCSQGALQALVFRGMWRLVTFCAAIVVSIDHHRALMALGIPMAVVWRRWMYLVCETEVQVINRKPDYQFLRQVNLDYS
ncbi:sugar transferase, partial [Kaarinaea lacus]